MLHNAHTSIQSPYLDREIEISESEKNCLQLYRSPSIYEYPVPVKVSIRHMSNAAGYQPAIIHQPSS